MRSEIAGKFEAGAVALRKTGLDLRDVGAGTADNGVEALIIEELVKRRIERKALIGLCV